MGGLGDQARAFQVRAGRGGSQTQGSLGSGRREPAPGCLKASFQMPFSFHGSFLKQVKGRVARQPSHTAFRCVLLVFLPLTEGNLPLQTPGQAVLGPCSAFRGPWYPFSIRVPYTAVIQAPPQESTNNSTAKCYAHFTFGTYGQFSPGKGESSHRCSTQPSSSGSHASSFMFLKAPAHSVHLLCFVLFIVSVHWVVSSFSPHKWERRRKYQAPPLWNAEKLQESPLVYRLNDATNICPLPCRFACKDIDKYNAQLVIFIYTYFY